MKPLCSNIWVYLHYSLIDFSDAVITCTIMLLDIFLMPLAPSYTSSNVILNEKF